MRNKLLVWAALLAALVTLAALGGAATADIIYLLNGNRIEGDIVDEGDDVVKIRTRVGVQEVYRDDIDRIERLKDPRAEYQRRAKSLSATGGARQWFQLGEWALDKGLDDLARQAWERSIVLDPEYEAARERLGYVRYRGQWLTDAEHKRAQGYVMHEGRWVTPDEKEKLDAGFVRMDGQWVHRNTLIERARKDAMERARELARRREAERRRAQPDSTREPARQEDPGRVAGGRDPGKPRAQPLPPYVPGQPPTPEQVAAMVEKQKEQARAAERTLGFTFEDIEEGPLLVHTTQPVGSERFRNFLRDLGKLYKRETEIYNIPFDTPMWPGKLQIYFFADKSQFDAFATRIDEAPGAVQSGGYFIHGASTGGSTLFHICMYNNDVGTLAHEMSHAFIARYDFSKRVVMPWTNEGVAEFLREFVAKEFGLGRPGGSGHKVAVREMLRRKDPRATLKHMMNKQDIAGTEGWAYALSWSIIDFMVAADKKAFVTFLKTLKRSDGSFNGDWTPASESEQIAAIEGAFGVDIAKFEEAWKNHALGGR
jgi:hypothetical protein